MSRYIKMTDAVKVMACEMYAEAQSQGYEADGVEDFMPEAKAWITDAPSIDIVFCRDCHWSRPRSLPGETGYRCVLHRIWKGENGFCDSGEREGE